MSLSVVYEQWEKERLDQGRDEGQQIGQQQERRSMALGMLQAGARVDFIVQVTGYTAEEIRSLQVQDVENLAQAHSKHTRKLNMVYRDLVRCKQHFKTL